MRNLLLAVALLSAGVMLMAADRPTNETALLTQLNGVPARFVMVDGGVSGMYGTGMQCVPITGGYVYKLKPLAPVNYVVRPQPGVTWDGGMSQAVGDMNFGDPLQPWQAEYVLTHKTSTHICQTTDAGSSAATPVWRVE